MKFRMLAITIWVMFLTCSVGAYEYGVGISRGDSVVTFGPETDPATETPESIAVMMSRWADHGYNSILWREISWLFGAKHHAHLIMNPYSRPLTIGHHYVMTDVAQAFDGIAVAKREAQAQGMEFWVWEEVWNDGTPSGPEPYYWPLGLDFLINNPHYQVVDRNGNYQYGVREMAWPQARQQKIDEFVEVVTDHNVSQLMIVLRTEMALTNPAPDTGDTMGFGQPVVDDMIRLYGVNIISDPRFDVTNPSFNINDPMVENWRELRGSYFTQFLRETRSAMNMINPNIKLGIYCNQGEYLGPPFGNMKQQWRTWVDEGLIDRIYTGQDMGSCIGGDCGTGYLSDRLKGIGVLPFSTFKAYIAASSHPEIKLIKGGSGYSADSDGSMADTSSEDKTFADSQRQAQIQQNLNIHGFINYIKQDFDGFQTYTYGRANGGCGDSRYYPSLNASPGWWERFGGANDPYCFIQNTIVHGDSGNAAKVMCGHGDLSARRTVSPGYSVDFAMSNGYATFESWIYRDSRDSDILISFRNFNQPYNEVVLWIRYASGRVSVKSTEGWRDTGYNLVDKKWHKLLLKLNLDAKLYSVYTGDNGDIELTTGAAWANTTYFDYIEYHPQNTTGSATYVDDVVIRWNPDQMPVPPGCGDPEHPYPDGDMNNDCVVNLQDLAEFANHWLQCSIPECNSTTNVLPPTVVFQDTFENHALGSNPVPGAADVGSWQGSGGIVAIQNAHSSGGTQGLGIIREIYGSFPSVLATATAAGNAEAGCDIIFTMDRLQIGGREGQPSWYNTAGVLFSFDNSLPLQLGASVGLNRFPPTNYYTYRSAGSVITSNVLAICDVWTTWEVAMHFVAGSTAGTVTGTYDVFITNKSTGQKFTICENIGIADNLPTNAALRAWIWTDAGDDYSWGGDNYGYYDNVMMEKVPEPATMALLGIGAIGLIRRKAC